MTSVIQSSPGSGDPSCENARVIYKYFGLRCRPRCRACRPFSIRSTPGRTRTSSTRPRALVGLFQKNLPSSKPRSMPTSAPRRRLAACGRVTRGVVFGTGKNRRALGRLFLFRRASATAADIPQYASAVVLPAWRAAARAVQPPPRDQLSPCSSQGAR